MKRCFKVGVTLVELMMVVSIISILTTHATPTYQVNRGKAQGVSTGAIKKSMTQAAQYYELDMGFYPPDVNRGWDPGFERAFPWNPDVEDGSHNGNAGIRCDHCPDDWIDIVAKRWDGPYMKWPSRTAWQGRFDYNIWDGPRNRYGCTVRPGIYAGAQGDYQNNNNVPIIVEEYMIDIGIDDDQCVNGESQLLLFPL